jgi:hypothetical protein
MGLHAALWPLLVAGSAGALTAAYLPDGLRYAGPYAAQTEVRWFVALSLFGAYVVVLVLACFVLSVASRAGGPLKRSLLVAAWLLAFWVATIFAPGLPYLGLVLACKAPPLCPDAANPIVWALGGVVRSHNKPFSPVWVVLFLGASVLWLRQILRP